MRVASGRRAAARRATLPAAAPADAAERILDVAERLVQTRGFNGFSYADVAAELAVTKASLHYHFATKADLGARLVGRYHQAFRAALDRIDAACGADALAKLEGYVRLYADVLRGGRLCLCGMLASDHATLPRAMRDRVNRFFSDNEAWLAEVVDGGRRAGALAFDGAALDLARALVASLEGAMLVAHAFGEPDRFDSAARLFVDRITAR